jgi:hypothetical protein
VVAISLTLAGGIIVFRQAGSGSSDGAQQAGSAEADAPQGASVAAAPQPGSAAAGSALSFQDHFDGTVQQSDDRAGGGTVDLQVSAAGERAVQLTIHLVLSAGLGGRQRVSGNQAVLVDATTGAQLCLGQATALDHTGFAVRCQGAGANAGTSLEVDGTITGGTDPQIHGDLQVAPLDG